MPARSYLYVPGDRRDFLEKAVDRGADALILDLEDSVAPSAKNVALDTVAGWAGSRQADRPEIWVRVNPERLSHEVRAVVGSALTGIVLPKADPELLLTLDTVIRESEVAAGLQVGRVVVVPLVETASACLSIAAIATAPRVRHLSLGEADLSGELRLEPSEDDRELGPLRMAAVVASAAAGIAAPVGSVSTEFRDLERLRRSTEALRRMGFRGRSAVHPAQVAVINEVFTPSAEEVARARELLARFEAAGERGEGVITDEEGRMVDGAVIRSARETLSLAEAAGR